jgi:hypothetical protein
MANRQTGGMRNAARPRRTLAAELIPAETRRYDTLDPDARVAVDEDSGE